MQYSYTTFIMEMGKLFNDFINGNAILKINNPDELYTIYRMFHRSSIIFANTNLMEDIDVIGEVAKRHLRYLDLSRDQSTNGAPLPPAGFRIATRALFYYLKFGKYGFKGFPVYLHINDEWNDRLYAYDPQMVAEMNINPSFLRQVEFLYARNQKIYLVNEMNPVTLFDSPEVPLTAVWEEYEPPVMEDTKFQFVPLELVNTINNNKRYPIAVLASSGLIHIQEMITIHNESVLKMHKQSMDLLLHAIDTMNETDVISRTTKFVDKQLVDDLIAVLFEKAYFVMRSIEDYDSFAAIIDFTTFGSLTALAQAWDTNGGKTETEDHGKWWGDETYIVGFNRWRNPIVQDASEAVMEEFIGRDAIEFTQAHREFFSELLERILYFLNAVQNLSLTAPCFGGTIPPRFVYSLRDIVMAEQNEEVPESNDET